MRPDRTFPLGLGDPPAAAAPRFVSAATARPAPTLELSVILPARNEQDVLPGCLESLLAQDDPLTFSLGRDWELLIVDDASTDDTAAIARKTVDSHPGVSLQAAPSLDPKAFTGKSNACWSAAHEARGRWLLFTDADTLHEPGSLARALHEAGKYQVALLSYSPRQIVSGIAQRLLMPLIFSELASVYPTDQVNDPNRRLAAANGQFLMVDRETYFRVGGHRAVGTSVLEDVDLAVNVKRAATRGEVRGIRFRYAPDALSTRMYRGFSPMLEGWTKNLALLFPHALALAAWRALDLVLFLLPLLLILLPHLSLMQRAVILLLWVRTLFRFYSRVARSHFRFLDCALSPLGLPLFIALLIRSWMQHKLFHQVAWKGREYRTRG